MHVTLPIIEASYDFLLATPPFRRWDFPPADDVEFHVVRNLTDRGWYRLQTNGVHQIGISSRWLSHSSNIIGTMAHEMVHMRQAMAGTETPNAKHNAEFWRLARLVCREHGFDPRLF